MLRLLRAPLALTGFVTLVSWLCFAACSGATDDEFQGTQENDAGGEPVYDEALAISNCESGCSAFADSCMASCTPGCDSSLRLSNAEICPGQFYAYYSCVGAAAAGDFDCDAGDTSSGNPVAACAEQWIAYSQCRRTEGFECVILAHGDSGCLDSTGLPMLITCRVDRVPESGWGCVPFNDTDYCCLEQG